MKIAVIGAGNVGSTLASFLLLRENLEQIALFDLNYELASGKSLDLAQMAAILSIDTKVLAYKKLDDLINFDIFVITAGFARKDNQDRSELLIENGKIVSEISKSIAKIAPNSLIIMVTNPLDEMVWVALKSTKFDKNRVIGMAGELDSGRFKYELCSRFDVFPSTFDVKTIGLHNSNMIFPKSCVNLKHNDEKKLIKAKDEAINGGAKIVNLLKTSAYYAPAIGIAKIISSINEKINDYLSCSTMGDDGYVYGRLVKIGKTGIYEVLEPKLECDEIDILEFSLLKFEKNIEILKKVLN